MKMYMGDFYGKSKDRSIEYSQRYVMGAIQEQDCDSLKSLVTTIANPQLLAANAVHSLPMLKILLVKPFDDYTVLGATLSKAIKGRFIESALYIVDISTDPKLRAAHNSISESLELFITASSDARVLAHLLNKAYVHAGRDQALPQALVLSVRDDIACLTLLIAEIKKRASQTGTFPKAIFVKALISAVKKCHRDAITALIPCVSDRADLTHALEELINASLSACINLSKKKCTAITEKAIVIAAQLIEAGAQVDSSFAKDNSIELTASARNAKPLLEFLASKSTSTSTTSTQSIPVGSASTVGLFKPKNSLRPIPQMDRAAYKESMSNTREMNENDDDNYAYELYIDSEYNDHLANFLIEINHRNKISCRLKPQQMTALEANPQNNSLLSIHSKKFPDVPVRLAGHLYDLSELLSLLEHSNKAAVPNTAGESTFTYSDINPAKEVYYQIDDMILEIEEEEQEANNAKYTNLVRSNW